MKLGRFIEKRVRAIVSHPAVKRTVDRMLPFRLWIILPVHLALFALSYGVSMAMLDQSVLEGAGRDMFLMAFPALALIRLAVFWWHDLYQGLWRYASFQDLLNIIRATVISTVLFVGIGVFWSPLRIPERLAILDLGLCIVFSGGIRFAVRYVRERFSQALPAKAIKNILLVGPLGKIEHLVKEFAGDPASRYKPYAIVDPTRDALPFRIRVHDVPVLSLSQVLNRTPGMRGLEAIVICWPEATKKEMDQVVENLKALHTPFKTLPPVEHILSERVSINDIRDVEIDDLLERPPVRVEMDRISKALRGRSVMVTGGAGSIGSELCRQIAGFNPGRLVIVERSENSLYSFERELRETYPGLALHASISSINDGPGMLSIMRDLRVEVVFHAAAYKHVPLMETAPVESAYNNVLGTYNVSEAAIQAGVERFVMVSTDKAVNPANVMGVTKRIAEMVIQSNNGSHQTRFMVVRFGNVLGSAGSVIPIFKKQILQGKPVTVTHPDIERFFMTIPEAVQLVLQAGCMGKGGEIYVLDMGSPMKIVNLAEKLITLSGKRPYEDIDIRFTGLRPGEKMYEELLQSCETNIETAHPRILAAVSEAPAKEFMERQVEEIRDLVANHDRGRLVQKFRELVPGYMAQECKEKARAFRQD
jgi:FlaA1/EpsC-like NDP-sugar epimerase